MKRPTAGPRPWMLALTALLLFAATAASRIPFTSQWLYAWDSANFALALNQYNVVFHQPHPPGYPVYVGIASLVDLWVHDANASYVYISIFASAAAVAFLFLLATAMYDFWVGLVAALLLGASVGFWGYGEVAYAYAALALFGTLVAYLCYLMREGHRWVAVLSGLAMGIAGGVREDTLIFLGPLWLLSLGRAGAVRFLLSLVVFGLTVASWLLPAVQLSGGWEAFQTAYNAQSSYVVNSYSLLGAGGEALRRNSETLMLFLKQMFGLTALVTLYFLGRFLTLRALAADRRVFFLLVWVLPPLLVYLVVHIGDPGYVLSLLPALCLVTAVGIQDIARDARSALLLVSSQHRALSWLARPAGKLSATLALLLVMGLVAWNTDAFLRTPGPARLVEIRTIDHILDQQIGYARGLQPDSVVVLAKERLRQFKYYLSGYDVRLLYDEYQQGYLEADYSYQIPNGVNTVLIMDFGGKTPPQITGATGGPLALDGSPGNPVGLWQFDVKPGDTIQYGYNHFSVKRRS